MEAVSTSETPVNFYQTTRFYVPEDSHVHNEYKMSRRTAHVLEDRHSIPNTGPTEPAAQCIGGVFLYEVKQRDLYTG
jgi:hypothetical protein